ncbi:unnamed protein product [Cladocopium goreaui]|uniref:Poly [ADP-ribose] polymerase n=1 Tax=Cladocopium goreaui TaxID=2562237 RepID=A0A9P1DHL1_9DINO|nr:unnamed protein product [Cladocopium goreaui]
MDWLWGSATAATDVGTQCLQSTGTVGTQCFPPSLESAARMVGEQRYDEAYGSVMEHVKVFELAKGFSLLAKCAYELGRYEEVPDLVASSIAHLGPEQEHVLHLAGLAFLKMDRCEEAYLSLRRALQLRPTCAKIHGALKDVAEKMQAQSQEMIVPYLWQYQEQDGSWSDMPLALCEKLESAFANYQAAPQSALLKMHGREFDFGTMRQRNVASGRWRSVRRQCVAAMVNAGSITAQMLQHCLSQTVASRQAIAAAEDVREKLGCQLDLLARQEPALMKTSGDLNVHKASLNQWQKELQIKEASVKELQKNIEGQEAAIKEEETRLKLKLKALRLRETSLEQRINEEIEARMAELEAKLRNRTLKIAAANLGLDDPKGSLPAIIFGQRQEIEFWRSGNPCQDKVLLYRLGCGQAMFLQDGTLVEPMQQLLLGTAEPHNKPFNGKVSICQQMSGVQVHRVLRVVNPALWRAYWERKAKLRGGRSGRIQPLPKTQEMKHLETIAFEVAPDQKTLGATYWIYVDTRVNEMLLFHGTSATNAESIATNGFDLSRVRQGLYGNGFYFSCEACKSFQYTTLDTAQSERCIIVARVLLGNPKYAQSALKGADADLLRTASPGAQPLPLKVGAVF